MKYFFSKTAPKLFTTLFLLFIFLLNRAQAQEHTASENHPAAHGHKLTFALGHAHVSKELEAGQKKWLTMGALALNYDYQFNEKWALGTHNDVIFEEMPVVILEEGAEHKELERAYPLATRLVGSYIPGKHTAFMVGIGDEIAGANHHFLSTVGIDYGWHLAGGWELGGELTYDFVSHSHDTWVLGVGISKILSSSHHKGHK